MTEPRPYRAGLGLPPVFTIRSAEAPSRDAHDNIVEHDFDAEEDQYQAEGSHPGKKIEKKEPIVFEALPKHLAWPEWNVNPYKHGPDRLKRPPTFVKSTITYDELGRSVSDGVEVDVDTGRYEKVEAAKAKREVDSGDKVKDWYLSLAKGSGSNAASVPTVASRPASRTPTYIPPDPPKNPLPMPVKRQDWFVRRPLVASHSLPSSRPSTPAPSSISSLLSLSSIPNAQASNKGKEKAHYYALGPENKGYGMLQRLGWGGGGLGKPEGWTEVPVDGTPPSQKCSIRKDDKGRRKRAHSRPEDEVQETDPKGNPIIDLTLSPSPSPSPSPSVSPEPSPMSGPGRVTPISTALKLDRLGLGHLHTSQAKITHTQKEIVKAQKKAKMGHKRVFKGEEAGMSKKEKVDWKRKTKKDREERIRLMAALN
ncbi:hypothetical protein L202_04814 [Cryptococcus amylolentus CBS 6039]|uniref:G-patch domain-containing protein n=1 Tax=Cryptococcus amylolentus CBS 6039 TaxID=1295533 RepID=A0A1E3HMU0_9TREE|nr:hypothetical protein L202_04814 [Cryptococcus amylolentus CBS 6039]ODN77663.1 hypothetical protein L202_04814 [Cryptococcus amylolentus CBS 6039]